MKRSMCINSLQGKLICGDPAGKRSLARDMAAVRENTLPPMVASVTVRVMGRYWWHFKEWHHNKNRIYTGIRLLLVTFVMQQRTACTGKVSGVLLGRLLKPILAVTAGLDCICTGLKEPLSCETADSVLCLK